MISSRVGKALIYQRHIQQFVLVCTKLIFVKRSCLIYGPWRQRFPGDKVPCVVEKKRWLTLRVWSVMERHVKNANGCLIMNPGHFHHQIWMFVDELTKTKRKPTHSCAEMTTSGRLFPIL